MGGSTQPKVSKVVSYKHGLSFIERVATVEGDETLELRFPDSSMDDILKSLTLYDQDGGVVSSVSSQLDVTPLRSFNISVPPTDILQTLFPSLQGAQVKLVVGKNLEIVEGIFVGVDGLNNHYPICYTEKTGDSGQHPIPFYVILKDGKSLVNVPTTETKCFTILKEGLCVDLEDILRTSLAEKSRVDSRRVSVYCRGEGKRRISIQYAVESPSWLCTYRLALGEGDQVETGVFQAWAVLHNRTDDDWEEVAVTLVSGRPLSLAYDLKTPRYPPKAPPIPHAQPQMVAFGHPPRMVKMHQQQYHSSPFGPPQPSFITSSAATQAFCVSGAAAPSFSFGGAPAPAPPEDLDSYQGDRSAEKEIAYDGSAPEATGAIPVPDLQSALEGSIQTAVEMTEIAGGTIREVRVQVPTTILRNEVALVPLLNTRLQNTARVALYQPKRRTGPPQPFAVSKTTLEVKEGGPVLVALRVTNDSSLLWEEGPLTILQGGTFVGQTVLPLMKPRQTQLLPYAVEFAVKVEANEAGDVETLPAESSELNGDRLEMRNPLLQPMSYKVTWTVGEGEDSSNPSPSPSTYVLYVDVPLGKDVEITADEKDGVSVEHRADEKLARLNKTISPGTNNFPYTVHTKKTQYHNANVSQPLVDKWVAEGSISREMADCLKEQADIATNNRELKRRNSDLMAKGQALQQKQQRLRENMVALQVRDIRDVQSEKEKALREDYVAEFARNEKDLRQLEEDYEKAQAQLRDAEEAARKRGQVHLKHKRTA